MGESLPSVGEFGALWAEFMRAMMEAAERPGAPLLDKLRSHLGVEPGELPVTTASFSVADRPNLQLAFDVVMPDREAFGFQSGHMMRMGPGLADLVARSPRGGDEGLAPVEYADVEVGDGRVIRCWSSAVVLSRFEECPVVLLVTSAERPPMGQMDVRVEGIAAVEGAVSRVLESLRAAMLEHSVFRGRIISLNGAGGVAFHALPDVPREAVVLPDGTLERLERHASGIADRADVLRAVGRHLKRGLLLHGPPGTGERLTVNHLLSVMPGRTTVLLTGRGLGFIETAVAIARDLAPATVVLEDVDLVAAERTLPGGGQGVLFELLNQMDGLAEDADLLFVLTTNRPDVIEPALAARPGRVDLALETPLPDGDARRRLLRLYARGIELDDETAAELADRSDGVTGAFIKELMRQAVVRAAIQERSPTADDIRAALDELLAERAVLTRRLLGQPGDGNGPAPGGQPIPPMIRAIEAAGLPIPPGIDFGP